MVKPTKHYLKQAARAEAVARRSSDSEISEEMLAMARGYRSQAEILKRKKQEKKERKKKQAMDKAIRKRKASLKPKPKSAAKPKRKPTPKLNRQ